MLTYNAFTVDDAPVRREAQRCLANALLLKPDDRGTFAEVGGVDKFVAAFRASVKKRDADDDFLLGRIGFLLTATKGPVVERLVHGDAVLEDMNEVRRFFGEVDFRFLCPMSTFARSTSYWGRALWRLRSS